MSDKKEIIRRVEAGEATATEIAIANILKTKKRRVSDTVLDKLKSDRRKD